MLMGKLKKEWSTIVNIASSAWYFPLPGMAIYAASKSFLLNRSRSLRSELYGECNVITFSPSGTNTNFQGNAWVKKGNDGEGLLSPEFVANKIYKSVIDRKKNFILLSWIKTKWLFLILKNIPIKISTKIWWLLFKKLR